MTVTLHESVTQDVPDEWKGTILKRRYQRLLPTSLPPEGPLQVPVNAREVVLAMLTLGC